MNKLGTIHHNYEKEAGKIVCTIYGAKTPARFTPDEAKQLIKYLLSITRKSKNKVLGLNAQLSYLQGNKKKVQELKSEVNEAIQKWSDHMLRLGVVPNALWKVKIMSQNKNFYWEFPSSEIH